MCTYRDDVHVSKALKHRLHIREGSRTIFIEEGIALTRELHVKEEIEYAENCKRRVSLLKASLFALLALMACIVGHANNSSEENA